MVGSSAFIPSFAPGKPTFKRPVRNGRLFLAPVVLLFVLCGWDVPDRLEQSPIVEPVHPFQRSEFHGLIFCTVVGLTFGMWPAVRASRMTAVEALRYE